MPTNSKVTAAVWGPLEKYIITGHEKGELIAWDVKVIDNGDSFLLSQKLPWKKIMFCKTEILF